MVKTLREEIKEVLSANPDGLSQYGLARKVGSQQGYVRKLTLVMEKSGECRIVESTMPHRITIFPPGAGKKDE